MTDANPATPVLTPYRRLLARLEADRAGHLRAAGQTTDETLRTAGSSYAAALHHAAVAATAEFEGAEAAQAYAQQTSGGGAGTADDDSLNPAELTAEEARDLAADLGLELYRAQDALAFVEECCVIADREGRTVTTAAVREWLKGARCGRQLTADVDLEKSAAEFKSGAATLNSPAATDLCERVASCPGYETSPNPCRCPCYGCKHHCSAHNPDGILAVPADRPAVLFVPPAADGLPVAALDSATDGASALDAWARDPHGRNFLAHALVQLARDGWLRAEPDEGFEPVRDREASEPEDPAGLRMADEAQQVGRVEVEPKRTPMNPVHILGIGSEDQNEAAALRARLLARLTEARANETGKDKVRCTCGGWFPIRHLHADTHQPAAEAQQAGEGGALKRAHVALAEQAGRDQAALARVRALHDNLVASSELTSPDDSITRGAAARRIAAAIDGVTDQPAN